jgi:tetratricopeptide (TPR) repeat protein
MSDRSRILMEQAKLKRRTGRLLDAYRDFTEAVTLCRQAEAPRDLVQALKGLGQIERDLGRGDAARPLYEEAVAICRDEDDALQLAHTVRHLGDIHQDAGRLDLAEPCYREALAIYRDHPRTGPLDLANTLRPFAILQEGLGKAAQAVDLWTEANHLYAALGQTIAYAADVNDTLQIFTRRVSSQVEGHRDDTSTLDAAPSISARSRISRHPFLLTQPC